MKKTILIFVVASLSLVACKKEYRCECSNGAYAQANEKVKKSEAEDFCIAFEVQERLINSSSSINCSLK